MTAAKRKQPESLDLSPPVNAPKRKRIRGRALVELFNEVAGSPLSNEVSPILPNRSSYCLNRQSLLERVETLVDSDSESSSSSQSTSSTENSSLSDEDYSDEGENQQPQLLPNESDSDASEAKALSVLPFDPEPEHCSSGYLLEAGAPLLNESLFEGSQVSVADATYLTELFCSRFNLSDECSSSLHQLIKTLLPKENNFPSAYSYIKKMKKNFEEEVCFLKKTNSQSICVLNFRFQLRDIIERNLPSILDYSLHRESNPYSDFNKDICPPFRREENATFNLILFSDGVNIKKSTLKRELWPIWIQIADLPPVLRMSRKNIVLAALFAGSKYPSWKMMVPLIKGQLISGVEISQKTGHPFRAYFKVRILVSDLCAKSHMLNMFKFNGYYGCNFCTAEGATIGRTHAYYPFEQSGQLREPVVNDVYVKCAEILGVDRLVNVVGIKGKSAFADLVEGLPLTAPVDYMHCVLLGVFPELLKLCFKSLSSEDKIIVSQIISNLTCPREMIAYSRKIRPLEVVAQFKANEHLNWLLYISPVVFLNRISSDLYDHLIDLVFGVKLLLESSSASNVSAAQKFLDNFCRNIVSIHGGNERIETINVHCLKHLAEEVKRFGPLWCYSAMSFEAANRTLGDVFSGSHSECEIICRRVLQRHNLTDFDELEPDLRQLFCKISGNPVPCSEKFDQEFVETEALRAAKRRFPAAIFFNRQLVENVYFDSPCYRRSKQGNCYVCFIKNGEEFFGQILYFIQFLGRNQCNSVMARVLLFKVIENIGPVEGYFYRVKKTAEENLVSLKSLTKVFFFSDSCNEHDSDENTSYIIKLSVAFEHS